MASIPARKLRTEVKSTIPVTAEAWYYRMDHRDEVVVSVKLGETDAVMIQFSIRHRVVQKMFRSRAKIHQRRVLLWRPKRKK